MKKIITICAAILMTASVFAQAPNKMSYQAVVRDAANNLVASSSVGMQISILQGSPSGTAIYVETQTPTSNSNGLVTIEIGGGSIVSGDFSSIDWANGPYYIQTETDPTGGANYTITGTSQLLSVPYAMYAKNTDSWTVSADTVYTEKSVGIGTQSPRGLYDFRNPNGGIYMDNGGTTWIERNAGNTLIIRNSSNSTTNTSSIRFDRGDGSGISSAILTSSDLANGVDKLSFSVGGSIRLMLNANGNIGIGTLSPQRPLHINDVMRLEPRSSAPSSPGKGDIYFDNTLNKLRVYDGTTWQNCW